VAKPRADAAYVLPGPFPKGDALLHGGCHGAGKFRLGIHQGVKACRHDGVQTCFEVSQMAELADDPPADLLDHVGDVGVGRGLALEKAGLEARFSAIQIDALHEDAMEMQVQIDRTAKTLDKRDRSRVDGGPLDTSFARLVDVILTDGGANDRMDLCRQVT
jgi:hypothetical protein